MRITREEAASNRARIVEAAARLFREKGFDGVGVADLMHAAGFTHGGFYNHFASKEELETAACDLVFEKAADGLARRVAGKSDSERNAAWADYVGHYLSATARDAAAAHCPIVALANDAVRQGSAIRQRFAAGVGRYIEALGAAIAPSRRITADETQANRDEAIVALVLLVGGLLLARGVMASDLALSDEILAAVREAIGPRL